MLYFWALLWQVVIVYIKKSKIISTIIALNVALA